MDGLPKELCPNAQLSQQFQSMYITRNQFFRQFERKRQPVKTNFRTIPISSLRDQLSGQFQLIDRLIPLSRLPSKSIVRAIPISRQYPQSIGRTFPINTPPSKSIVQTIPINREYPKSIGWTIPVDRKSPKLIVQAMPIDRQSPRSIARTIHINT